MVMSLSFADDEETRDEATISKPLQDNEVVLLIDLDSKQSKKDGTPIWDEHHVCRPWSEFASGRAAPLVLGYSAVGTKQTLSSLGANQATSVTGSSTSAASTTTDSGRTNSESSIDRFT
jgi:hypothetical protein